MQLFIISEYLLRFLLPKRLFYLALESALGFHFVLNVSLVWGLFKVDVSQLQRIKHCPYQITTQLSGNTKRNYRCNCKSHSASFSMNIKHMYLWIMPTILEGLKNFRILLLSRLFENLTWLPFHIYAIQIKYILCRENTNNSQKNVIASEVNNFLMVIVTGVTVWQMINMKKIYLGMTKGEFM